MKDKEIKSCRELIQKARMINAELNHALQCYETGFCSYEEALSTAVLSLIEAKNVLIEDVIKSLISR